MYELNVRKTLPGKKHRASIVKDLRRDVWIYVLAAVVLAYYVLFHYLPMYGAIIAFKDYDVAKGITGSSWVGLKHFKAFFSD